MCCASRKERFHAHLTHLVPTPPTYKITTISTAIYNYIYLSINFWNENIHKQACACDVNEKCYLLPSQPIPSNIHSIPLYTTTHFHAMFHAWAWCARDATERARSPSNIDDGDDGCIPYICQTIIINLNALFSSLLSFYVPLCVSLSGVRHFHVQRKFINRFLWTASTVTRYARSAFFYWILSAYRRTITMEMVRRRRCIRNHHRRRFVAAAAAAVVAMATAMPIIAPSVQHQQCWRGFSQM